MATHHDGGLILQLYDLRREKKMRKARDFVLGEWFPESTEEVLATLWNRKASWKVRQVLGYWEMACALVNSGALDPDLFDRTNGEFWVLWAKLEPFMEELRAGHFGPRFLREIETFIAGRPDREERLAGVRKRFAGMAEAARERREEKERKKERKHEREEKESRHEREEGDDDDG